MNRRQNDRPSWMQGDIDLITHFDSSEIHERSIKDDPLGIADLGNGLGHACNTMFYAAPIVNRASTLNFFRRGLVLPTAWRIRYDPIASSRTQRAILTSVKYEKLGLNRNDGETSDVSANRGSALFQFRALIIVSGLQPYQ